MLTSEFQMFEFNLRRWAFNASPARTVGRFAEKEKARIDKQSGPSAKFYPTGAV